MFYGRYRGFHQRFMGLPSHQWNEWSDISGYVFCELSADHDTSAIADI